MANPAPFTDRLDLHPWTRKLTQQPPAQWTPNAKGAICKGGGRPHEAKPSARGLPHPDSRQERQPPPRTPSTLHLWFLPFVTTRTRSRGDRSRGAGVGALLGLCWALDAARKSLTQARLLAALFCAEPPLSGQLGPSWVCASWEARSAMLPTCARSQALPRASLVSALPGPHACQAPLGGTSHLPIC